MSEKLGDMIGTEAAAKTLGVSVRRVQQLIADKVLPATTFGGTYMIRRADLAKVPKERKPGPKPKGK